VWRGGGGTEGRAAIGALLGVLEYI